MKKDRGSDRISTFIGADAIIEGNIEFRGTIRVDGKVTGKITSTGGTMIVGENAVVNADAAVNVAVIRGELNGGIDAKERIEVYPPGKIGGDINSPLISIEPGGVFNGNCLMRNRPHKGGEPVLYVNNQPQDKQAKEKKS